MSDPYDPQAVEGASPSQQYVTKKDVKIVLIVLVVLLIIGIPVYFYMLKGVYKSICAKNFKQLGTALNLYMEEHDERYPFAYTTATYESDEPSAFDNGLTYTWQQDLRPFISDPTVFKCPAASDEENNRSSGNGTDVDTSSYGMVYAYSGQLAVSVADPKSQIILGETIDRGRKDTVDPLPLKSFDGREMASDGYVIGFDTSNTFPNKQTTAVTRLAFPGSKTTGYTAEADSRHPGGIHFLYCDGHVSKSLDGTIGRITQDVSGLGPWSVPKKQIRH